MKYITYSKKKDEFPKKTIENIKNKLAELDIFPKEIWATKTNNLYSVRLVYLGRQMAEGKGTTKDYALASGYGELIERLQNNVSFHFKFDESASHKELSINDFIKKNPTFAKKDINSFLEAGYFNLYKKNDTLNEKQKLEKLNKISLGKESKILDTVEFYNVNENKILPMPFDIIRTFCTYNGMCSGNTKEEALVQGISEIFERYAGGTLVLKNIIPPDIPKEDYIKYKKIKQIIDYYNSLNLDVLIKDFSLGKGLPTVGVFIIDKKNHSYCSSIAAHPCLPIAIERCFTEIKQERDITAESFSKYMTNVSLNPSAPKNMLQNLTMLVQRAVFDVSYEFFTEEPSYTYNPETWLSTKHNNKYYLNKMFEIIKQNFDGNIYIRDMSFLGFNTYWVVIPQLSIVYNDEELLNRRREAFKYLEIIKKRNKAEDDLKTLLIGLNYHIEFYMEPYDVEILPNKADIILAAFCEFKLKNYENTKKLLEYFFKKEKQKNTTIYDLMHCFKTYIELLLCNKDNINTYIENFYNENIIDLFNKIFLKEEGINILISTLINRKSKDKTDDSIETITKISEKLTKLYKDNIPNQQVF